jgi:Uma2 family endonuclease
MVNAYAMGENALGAYTLADYLELEASSQERFEFHDGFIRFMAGGSVQHSEVAGNVLSALKTALRAGNKPCRVLNSDVKVAIHAASKRYYPDVSVVCGPVRQDPSEPHAIVNPVLAAEVLSNSTELQDRGEKLHGYRMLESLHYYLLIDPLRPSAECYSRQADGTWIYQCTGTLDGVIALPVLGISLRMDDLYYQAGPADPA